MTDKLFIGSEVDCNTVRVALDIVMNFPTPPLSGPFSVNEATRLVRVQEWFAMTQEQRNAIIADPNNTAYEGWSLQFTDIYYEYTPGTRTGCFLPDNVASLITTAAAAGRTLTIDQALALTAAQATWIDDFPANWITPPP